MKKFFVIGLLISLMVLTGCSGSNDTAKTDKKSINVYNWGDYIDEETIAEFTKETGINVVYENFGNNEELLSKIESNSTDYDVIVPSDYMVDIMAKKGLLQKLDFDNIPNYKYIDPRLKGLNYDKNNEYSVPYMWQTVGIVYNKSKVKKPVDSWNILWDKDYARKIIMLDSPRDTIGITLKKLGYSLNTTDMNQLNQAKEELIKQKPILNSYQIDTYKTMLLSGDADISLAWSGDAFYMNTEDENMQYSIPKEGTNVSVDCFVIPTQAKHKKEAEEFINFMNKPEIALKNAEYIMYSSPNTEAIKLLPDEVKNNPQMYPQGPLDKIGEIFVDLGDFNKEYDKVWTEIKAAQ